MYGFQSRPGQYDRTNKIRTIHGLIQALGVAMYCICVTRYQKSIGYIMVQLYKGI